MRRKLICIVVLVMSAVLLTGCLYNPNPIELRNILKEGTEKQRLQSVRKILCLRLGSTLTMQR